MDKETSAHVSSIASRFLNLKPTDLVELIDSREPDDLAEFCTDIRTLAGSALSQDQTPGQDKLPDDFLGRLKREHAELSGRRDALTLFLGREHPEVSEKQIELLGNQASAMSVYRNILKQRIDDLEKSNG